jgi:WD40 repeat protein
MKSPNPDTLKLVHDFSRPAIVFAVARQPHSAHVFLGASDFQVSEGDLSVKKFEPKDLYAHGSYVTGVALAGQTLVSGGYDGKLIWWDTAKRKQIRATDAHQKWVRKVVASPDGKRIASVADDMACKVWDAATGKLLHELHGHEAKTPTHYPSMLFTAGFSPDGRHLATADKVGHVVVWDAATGQSVSTVESPGMYTWDPVQRRHSIGGARSVAFSPDGGTLAVGGIGKIGNIDHLEGKARVELFDWRAKKSLGVVESDKFKGLVNRLQFAPDGSWLLGAGGAGEGFFLFIDPAKRKIAEEKKVPMHVHDFAMSEAANMIYAVGHRKVAVYKME